MKEITTKDLRSIIDKQDFYPTPDANYSARLEVILEYGESETEMFYINISEVFEDYEDFEDFENSEKYTEYLEDLARDINEFVNYYSIEEFNIY